MTRRRKPQWPLQFGVLAADLALTCLYAMQDAWGVALVLAFWTGVQTMLILCYWAEGDLFPQRPRTIRLRLENAQFVLTCDELLSQAEADAIRRAFANLTP